jgi:hypothetical protein
MACDHGINTHASTSADAHTTCANALADTCARSLTSMKLDWRSFALGAAMTVLADRIIDVQLLTWPALAIALVCVVIGGVEYGRRLY